VRYAGLIKEVVKKMRVQAQAEVAAETRKSGVRKEVAAKAKGNFAVLEKSKKVYQLALRKCKDTFCPSVAKKTLKPTTKPTKLATKPTKPATKPIKHDCLPETKDNCKRRYTAYIVDVNKHVLQHTVKLAIAEKIKDEKAAAAAKQAIAGYKLEIKDYRKDQQECVATYCNKKLPGAPYQSACKNQTRRACVLKHVAAIKKTVRQINIQNEKKRMADTKVSGNDQKSSDTAGKTLEGLIQKRNSLKASIKLCKDVICPPTTNGGGEGDCPSTDPKSVKNCKTQSKQQCIVHTSHLITKAKKARSVILEKQKTLQIAQGVLQTRVLAQLDRKLSVQDKLLKDLQDSIKKCKDVVCPGDKLTKPAVTPKKNDPKLAVLISTKTTTEITEGTIIMITEVIEIVETTVIEITESISVVTKQIEKYTKEGNTKKVNKLNKTKTRQENSLKKQKSKLESQKAHKVTVDAKIAHKERTDKEFSTALKTIKTMKLNILKVKDPTEAKSLETEVKKAKAKVSLLKTKKRLANHDLVKFNRKANKIVKLEKSWKDAFTSSTMITEVVEITEMIIQSSRAELTKAISMGNTVDAAQLKAKIAES
jgi:hypothetical protein